MLRSLALLLLLPVAALAADAAPGSWAAPLLDEVAKLLGVLVAAVLIRALSALREKLDADRRYVSDALLDQVAHRSAAWVEEKAAALAADGYGFGPAAKLEAAIGDVLAKVPGVSREQAERAVRAALVALGEGAAAKVREKRMEREREAAPEGPDGNP